MCRIIRYLFSLVYGLSSVIVFSLMILEIEHVIISRALRGWCVSNLDMLAKVCQSRAGKAARADLEQKLEEAVWRCQPCRCETREVQNWFHRVSNDSQ